MSTIPTIVVTPSAAADAYGRVDRGESGSSAGDFGTTLERTLQGAVDNFHAADAKTAEALTGGKPDRCRHRAVARRTHLADGDRSA